MLNLLVTCLIVSLYIANHLLVRNRFLDLVEIGLERRDKECRFERFWYLSQIAMYVILMLAYLSCS